MVSFVREYKSMAKLSSSSLKELVLMNTEKIKTKGKPAPANKILSVGLKHRFNSE